MCLPIKGTFSGIMVYQWMGFHRWKNCLIHKVGVGFLKKFFFKCSYKLSTWAKLGIFKENWYYWCGIMCHVNNGQDFEVRQAHPCPILFKKQPLPPNQGNYTVILKTSNKFRVIFLSAVLKCMQTELKLHPWRLECHHYTYAYLLWVKMSYKLLLLKLMLLFFHRTSVHDTELWGEWAESPSKLSNHEPAAPAGREFQLSRWERYGIYYDHQPW